MAFKAVGFTDISRRLGEAIGVDHNMSRPAC